MAFYEDGLGGNSDRANDGECCLPRLSPVFSLSGRAFGYFVQFPDTGSRTDGRAMRLWELCSGEVKYFVNCSDFTSGDDIILHLPKNKFIVAVPLSAGLTDERLTQCRRLRFFGYSLALTELNSIDVSPRLMSLFDYVKIPINSDFARGLPHTAARYPGKIFIASGVEDGTALQSAGELGFKLFEGGFAANFKLDKLPNLM
jgi:hypothetical protein